MSDLELSTTPSLAHNKWLTTLGIYGCAGLMGLLNGTKGVTPTETSAASLLLDLVIVVMLALWVDNDSRKSGKAFLRVWDFGFFLFLAWPAIIPYYLAKTRGLWRASLIVGAFAGCVVLGTIAAQLALQR